MSSVYLKTITRGSINVFLSVSAYSYGETSERTTIKQFVYFIGKWHCQPSFQFNLFGIILVLHFCLHHKQILVWVCFIVGEFCHLFILSGHCFAHSVLFLLVATFLLLCAWHEMTISSSPNDYDYGGWWWFLMMMLLMMMVVVDEERSKQKKKCLFFEFKVSGSYSINIKHTQSLKGKSKSTYTLHSTNIKCSINQGMFWDWSCFLNFHQI